MHHAVTIILSLGFFLSAGSWIASYWTFCYQPKSMDIVWLSAGAIDWLHPAPVQKEMWKTFNNVLGVTRSITVGSFEGLATHWIPSRQVYPSGMVRTILPLWIPTLFVGILLCPRLRSALRSRRRKAVGLCLKCGYDLRGQTEPRCPECGTVCSKRSVAGMSPKNAR